LVAKNKIFSNGCKRGGEGGGLLHHGELPRYAPPNNIVEMEVEASLIDDGGC